MKIKVNYREGTLLSLTLAQRDAEGPDVFEVTPDVYDVWCAWEAQGTVLQHLLSNLRIRRQLEDEVADLKAERASMWRGGL